MFGTIEDAYGKVIERIIIPYSDDLFPILKIVFTDGTQLNFEENEHEYMNLSAHWSREPN